jgi:hypothetical protein
VGEVRAVSGMHQRKAEMARQADAFIALPGAPLCYELMGSIYLFNRISPISCFKCAIIFSSGW